MYCRAGQRRKSTSSVEITRRKFTVEDCGGMPGFSAAAPLARPLLRPRRCPPGRALRPALPAGDKGRKRDPGEPRRGISGGPGALPGRAAPRTQQVRCGWVGSAGAAQPQRLAAPFTP